MTCDLCGCKTDLCREWGNGVVCWECWRQPVVLPGGGWMALTVDSGDEFMAVERIVGWEAAGSDGWRPLLVEGSSLWSGDPYVALVFHESERPSAEELKEVAEARRKYLRVRAEKQRAAKSA